MNSVTDCGFLYNSTTAKNGTITSPNFSGLYPAETECHYLFHGTRNERVHIRFTYMDVDGIQPQYDHKYI